MKRFFVLLFAAALARCAVSEPAPVTFRFFEYTGHDEVFAQPLPAGSYRNPILAGFYSDPSICRVGDDFYLINSTFAYFPGIPVFHSRDLQHWTQIGNVIHRPTQLAYDGLGVSRGIFAPSIRYHDGLFYVVCTMVDGGGNFLVTAKNPAGPWSDPVFFTFEGIDPSLFFDDDGRAWLVNNGAPAETPRYNGHRAIWLQEFDVASQKLIGPRQVIVNGGVDITKKPIWIEGPHLYKRDGWYYLCCAEGGTSEGHSQVILRSKAVTGPFVPWAGNPILTQRDVDGKAPQAVTSTGHADLVVGPDGNWWSVFLGCRPYANGDLYNTGRETFLLPVTWTEDGWPVILAAGQRVPYVLRAPQVAANPRAAGASFPLTGNFTWRDDFLETELSPAWMMLNAPTTPWWHAGGVEGGIAITPRQAGLASKHNPAYLGRRVQHARFEASAALAIPEDVHVSAGLVVFQNETHHYFFAVRRTGARVTLSVERANGKAPEVIAQTEIEPGAVLALRVAESDREIAFAYSTHQGGWKTLLEHADATLLSTKTAGGFVGATVGLHARLDP
jgi:alpha-N-arabinofuranosidase